MKIMNTKQILILLVVGILNTSCNKDDETTELLGNWMNRSAFDGVARTGAVGLVIGNYAFVGTGYNGDEYLNDWWIYDAENDYWEQRADFTGVKRTSASAFSANGKGYVGLGYDGTNKLKDFYEYNPDSNLWTQKADFIGSARYGAVGFQVAGNGYFGTGYDGNYLKDFYKYNTSTDTWVVSNGFGGNKRRNATVFTIGDKAYLGTGINNSVSQIDFWEFDGTTETWTQKRNINAGDEGEYNEGYSIIRGNASSFSINGKGYISCGGLGTSTWEYTPETDLWAEVTALESSSRNDAVGLSINNRGFVLLGRNGTSYYDDVLEFLPGATQVDND
jgi:hypothetical protein